MNNYRTRAAIETRTPEIDLEKRILRGVVAMTDRLASDGGIVLMPGLDTATYYERNPIVQAKHARAGDMSAKADVIGRATAMERTAHELVFEVQFADTELGREYAYLYGLNEKREVFMRSWSGGFRVLASDWLSPETARAQYAEQWDETVFASLPEWMGGRIEVISKSALTEFSAVARGADRQALTRALRGGVRAAADVLAEQEFDSLQTVLTRAMTASMSAAWRSDLERIERRVLALEGKGASAALRGDTDELREAIERMTQLIRR